MKRPPTGIPAPLRATFEDGEGLRVTLSGSIDESSDLNSIFAQVTKDATLNLRDIERVNSIGVHRWIPLMSAASSKHRIVIEEVSYALVQNANVVANLFGTASLHSCIAPYYCSTCNENSSVIVTAEDVVKTSFRPPAKRCGRCDTTLEFDELDGYFAFFKPRSRR